jgi:SAM-dependent methyltransferase
MNDLPDPVVPPEVYDDRYFLGVCAGHEEWTASGGAAAAGIYAASLDRAALRPEEIVVDVGTGRGELPALAVERGAACAIGVEYSRAAVTLARQTLVAHGVQGRAEVVAADARALPVASAKADLVTMLDVVEHLAPVELDRALSEAHRILSPGGRILIHTFPTRTIYEVTYRLQRLARRHRRRDWPPDPRNAFEHMMHVNEQSLWSLRRALRRAGFRRVLVTPGRWVYCDFVPDQRARRLYHRIARFPVTRRFGAANLWAEGRKPAR